MSSLTHWTVEVSSRPTVTVVFLSYRRRRSARNPLPAGCVALGRGPSLPLRPACSSGLCRRRTRSSVNSWPSSDLSAGRTSRRSWAARGPNRCVPARVRGRGGRSSPLRSAASIQDLMRLWCLFLASSGGQCRPMAPSKGRFLWQLPRFPGTLICARPPSPRPPCSRGAVRVSRPRI